MIKITSYEEFKNKSLDEAMKMYTKDEAMKMVEAMKKMYTVMEVLPVTIKSKCKSNCVSRNIIRVYVKELIKYNVYDFTTGESDKGYFMEIPLI